MKVKNLISKLKKMNPNANVWLDIPYIKGTETPYDLFINSFDVEKVWDKVDKENYVTLNSNQDTYDYFKDIRPPVTKSLKKH